MSRLIEMTRRALVIILVTALSVGVLECVLRFALPDPNDPAVHDAAMAVADTYQDADWVEPMFREYYASFQTHWQPYVYWRHAPHRGVYVNVDERGLRKTWNAPPPRGVRPRRIFVFGGSTVWGTGARDDHTIPSELSRRLARAGKVVEVTNFGQSGYVSSQEIIALYTRLQHGDVPDLVVFYDGINDTFSSFQSRIPGLPQNEGRRLKEFNLMRQPRRLLVELLRAELAGFRRLAARVRPPAAPRPMPDRVRADLIRDTLVVYARNLTFIRRLGDAYGFRTLFYWQPVLYTRDRPSPSEERAIGRETSGVRAFFEATWRAVSIDPMLRAHTHYGWRSLADLFDKAPGSYFVDFAHLGEEGNRRVAARIASDVDGLGVLPEP